MAANIFCVRTRQGLHFNRKQLHHSFAKLFAGAVGRILVPRSPRKKPLTPKLGQVHIHPDYTYMYAFVKLKVLL